MAVTLFSIILITKLKAILINRMSLTEECLIKIKSDSASQSESAGSLTKDKAGYFVCHLYALVFCLSIQCFNSRPDRVTDFFRQVMTVSLQEDLSYVERTILIIFLTHCFNSLVSSHKNCTKLMFHMKLSQKLILILMICFLPISDSRYLTYFFKNVDSI